MSWEDKIRKTDVGHLVRIQQHLISVLERHLTNSNTDSHPQEVILSAADEILDYLKSQEKLQ